MTLIALKSFALIFVMSVTHDNWNIPSEFKLSASFRS